jgi:ABC-2 type transport system permease protein
LVAGFIVLGAPTFITLGYLIAGLAKTSESLNSITQIFGFPMMFLSGLFTPLDLMPAWIKPASAALPLTYLADAQRRRLG